ncbi:protein GRIM REAPER-like [Hibiscus syriacus]|uniref:protein GRIM REAPER-like n=1 Tax=Hibiscus syriacus TaxID=106335 RepID=UPI001924A647|nr:protein GRIM REAPER-like [Hibiscus syriacus]
MASNNNLKLISILPLAISILLSFHPQATFPFEIADFNEEEEYEEYVLGHPLIVPNLRSRSRFLMTSPKKDKIRKSAHCEPDSYQNICNGISVNNGTNILYCCKTHCRNVLRDQNNCGECRNRCKFGQCCCGGVCTDVVHNFDHCGKCDNRCSPGVKCEFGYCGYA